MTPEGKGRTDPEDQHTSADSLLDAIVSSAAPTEERQRGGHGMSELLKSFVSHATDAESVDKLLSERLSAIDKLIADQVDEILHHPEVQALEAAWRGLKVVADESNYADNIRVEYLSASKRELLEDFDGARDTSRATLSRIMARELAELYGNPVATIIGNYEFGPSRDDLGLLTRLATVSAIAHAPFIAAASPSFFGAEDFGSLRDVDITGMGDDVRYLEWKAFRQRDEARYVGLTLPRFLARAAW